MTTILVLRPPHLRGVVRLGFSPWGSRVYLQLLGWWWGGTGITRMHGPGGGWIQNGPAVIILASRSTDQAPSFLATSVLSAGLATLCRGLDDKYLGLQGHVVCPRQSVLRCERSCDRHNGRGPLPDSKTLLQMAVFCFPPVVTS